MSIDDRFDDLAAEPRRLLPDAGPPTSASSSGFFAAIRAAAPGRPERGRAGRRRPAARPDVGRSLDAPAYRRRPRRLRRRAGDDGRARRGRPPRRASGRSTSAASSSRPWSAASTTRGWSSSSGPGGRSPSPAAPLPPGDRGAHRPGHRGLLPGGPGGAADLAPSPGRRRSTSSTCHCGGGRWLIAIARRFPESQPHRRRARARFAGPGDAPRPEAGLGDRIRIEGRDSPRGPALAGRTSTSSTSRTRSTRSPTRSTSLRAAWACVRSGGRMVVLDWCLPATLEESRSIHGADPLGHPARRAVPGHPDVQPRRLRRALPGGRARRPEGHRPAVGGHDLRVPAGSLSGSSRPPDRVLRARRVLVSEPSTRSAAIHW